MRYGADPTAHEPDETRRGEVGEVDQRSEVGDVGQAGQIGVSPRRRGSLALHEGRCTSCMVCARECPVWCIHIASHSATTDDSGSRADEAGHPATAGGRRRGRAVHVLDRFSIDFGLCMYCGICVDACPFDALAWTPDPVSPRPQACGLVLDKDQLTRAWAGVGEPGPLEVGAVPPDRSPRASRHRGGTGAPRA